MAPNEFIVWATVLCLNLPYLAGLKNNHVMTRYDWRTIDAKHQPKRYGDQLRNEDIYPHTSPKVRNRIVRAHNTLRSKVHPTASNMLRMSWHEGAARDAQLWADQCRLLTHDRKEDRRQAPLGYCGQNILVSSVRVPWYYVTKMWFREKRKYMFGLPSESYNLTQVGHYTQLVWATSHRIGCGLAYCRSGGYQGKPYYNYICNYCPGGNYNNKIGRPYHQGETCNECPGSCTKQGLCTNACPVVDAWSNCRALMNMMGKDWLCSPSGKECAATCSCSGDSIHEWQ